MQFLAEYGVTIGLSDKGDLVIEAEGEVKDDVIEQIKSRKDEIVDFLKPHVTAIASVSSAGVRTEWDQETVSLVSSRVFSLADVTEAVRLGQGSVAFRVKSCLLGEGEYWFYDEKDRVLTESEKQHGYKVCLNGFRRTTVLKYDDEDDKSHLLSSSSSPTSPKQTDFLSDVARGRECNGSVATPTSPKQTDFLALLVSQKQMKNKL